MFERVKKGKMPEEIFKIIKCADHEKVIQKLARIEGENIVIIVMLGIILTLIGKGVL